MAFRGTFEYTLDAKNRLTIPARFRSALSDGIVLARGTERCMAIWPKAHFEDFTEQALARFPPFSPQAEKLELWFSAGSHDTELDSAGRVMVPPFLLEHAGLSKDVVITGARGALKAWSPDRWATYQDSLADEITDIQTQLGHPA